MTQPIDDYLNDDELCEAFVGDAPEPTDAHVEQLRSQVLLYTKPSEPRRKTSFGIGGSPKAPQRRFQLPMSLALIAAAVLLALLVARPFVNDATAGLQQSLKTTREALWIHGSTTIQHEDKTERAESWCSPAERMVAFRSPQLMHFVDYEQGLQTSYSHEHGKVFQWNADPNMEGFGRQFVHALLNDQGLRSSFPLHDVSAVSKTAVDVDGNTATQYSYYVQVKANPDVRWKTSIRIDPTSGRIVHWEDQHANGMHVAILFDYPEKGPRNIFELGAPSAAEVIKIATPNSDLFAN